MVGQITPRAAQGLKLGSGGDGLETAIMYMKQEVDDAQRIAQMMAVRALPHQSSQRPTELSCWCSTQSTSGAAIMYMQQEVDDAQHIAEMMAVQQIAQHVIGVTCGARQTHGRGLRDRALRCRSVLCAACQSLPRTYSAVGKEDVLRGMPATRNSPSGRRRYRGRRGRCSTQCSPRSPNSACSLSATPAATGWLLCLRHAPAQTLLPVALQTE